MTVRELIEILKGHPDELRVVVSAYEDGYDDLSPKQISIQRIALNTGKHDWQGRHGEPEELPADASQPERIVSALVLRRTSH